MSLSCTYL